jgi:DMSO reductase family type II enzyme heme b subunit
MKKQQVNLMAAPVGMQPGGYVMKAYEDRLSALTATAELESENAGNRWRIQVRWAAEKPMSRTAGETDVFPDACALLVPTTADAPWITMGDRGKAVEGILWKADKDRPWAVRAEGLGTMERSEASESWKADAKWEAGYWTVTFNVSQWAALNEFKQFAVAIWQGNAQERGGLKSVTQGWVAGV